MFIIADGALRYGDIVSVIDAARGAGVTRVGIVTETISPDDVARQGRVNIAGEIWGALAVDGRVIEPGTHVRIKMVQGTRVVVEAIQNDVVFTPEEPA